MKTERRHELHSNLLADAVTNWLEKVKGYGKAILGAVLAVLVLAGTYMYLTYRARVEAGQDWGQVWSAMMGGDEKGLENVAGSVPDQSVGLWARLMMADDELNRGISALFTEKSVGYNHIRTALEAYQFVEQHATEPLARQHALFGIGRSEESIDQNDNLGKASAAYDKLVKDYPDGIYKARAQRRLDQLARDPVKNFYEWFQAVEPPKPAASKDSGPASSGSPSSGSPNDKDKPGVTLPPDKPQPDVGKEPAPRDKGSDTTPAPKPDGGKPDESKSDSKKSDDPKSATPSSDAGKKDAAKPDAGKDDAKK